jgi:PIN domain nuclease of toxin-antitoxin system
MSFVLDASALLALIQGEPGAVRVRVVMRQAALSSVNLTEVVTKLVAKGTLIEEVREILGGLEPRVHPHDEQLAIDAGAMHASTRRLGLSLGDRACLALAQRLGATALTTDRAWRGVDLGVAIEVIR